MKHWHFNVLRILQINVPTNVPMFLQGFYNLNLLPGILKKTEGKIIGFEMTIILCIHKCYSITNLEAQLSGLIFGFSIYQSKLNEMNSNDIDHSGVSVYPLCGDYVDAHAWRFSNAGLQWESLRGVWYANTEWITSGMKDNLFSFITGLSLVLSESRSADRLLSSGHSEGVNGLRIDPL